MNNEDYILKQEDEIVGKFLLTKNKLKCNKQYLIMAKALSRN